VLKSQQMVENKAESEQKEVMHSFICYASVFLTRLSVIETNSTFDKEVVSVENQ
jgi:hypothetical protein